MVVHAARCLAFLSIRLKACRGRQVVAGVIDALEYIADSVDFVGIF
jgi:hypothetical protein